MWYLVLIVLSLVVCVISARQMRSSMGLAVLFGLLLSPAAGIFYAYMALSGDQKPWRVALVGFGLCVAFIGLLLGILSSFSTSPAPQITTTYGQEQADAPPNPHPFDCIGSSPTGQKCP